MNFEGKAALVTDAAGGIGRAIVARLQAEGANALNVDQVRGKADNFIIGDLIDKAFCDGLPARAAEVMGSLDILINNAGIITRGDITVATDEDYARTMAINVEASNRLCSAAIPIMAAQNERGGGGAIVNTSSCWGVHPGSNHPVYVMSKASVASLTQCLGRDHAHQGIRVNAVCPNEVNTPMIRSGFEIRGIDPDKATEELNASVPIGRIGEPEDIADVVPFLASDDARYMCGALVEVNGGKPVS